MFDLSGVHEVGVHAIDLIIQITFKVVDLSHSMVSRESCSIKTFIMTIIIEVYPIPFNPYLTNGFPHHYHLDESTFILRGVRSDF